MVMSRQARQVAALVALLQALPEPQLDAVFDGLGVTREARKGAYVDTRRCEICGWGYVRHKAFEDDPNDGHAWKAKGGDA